MKKQHCVWCGTLCWHNPTKKGDFRCTKCGTPIPATNNEGKRQYLLELQRRARR